MKSKKENNWIDETKLWPKLSIKLFQVFDRFLKYHKEHDRSPKNSLGELRIQNIYSQVKAIELHLKDISTCLTYLRLKRIDPVLKSNKISKVDYIRFHYENHIIRVASTLDILAMLGNLIYETGLPERQINWDKFSTHEKIKNLTCGKVLKSFAAKIENIRKERHRIIHYGGHMNQIVQAIDMNTFDKKIFNQSYLSTYFFERKRVEETKKLEIEMKRNYALCLKYCKEFLDSLSYGVENINLA